MVRLKLAKVVFSVVTGPALEFMRVVTCVAPVYFRLGHVCFRGQRYRMLLVAVAAFGNFLRIVRHIEVRIRRVAVWHRILGRCRRDFLKGSMTSKAKVLGKDRRPRADIGTGGLRGDPGRGRRRAGGCLGGRRRGCSCRYSRRGR